MVNMKYFPYKSGKFVRISRKVHEVWGPKRHIFFTSAKNLSDKSLGGGDQCHRVSSQICGSLGTFEAAGGSNFGVPLTVPYHPCMVYLPTFC